MAGKTVAVATHRNGESVAIRRDSNGFFDAGQGFRGPHYHPIVWAIRRSGGSVTRVPIP